MQPFHSSSKQFLRLAAVFLILAPLLTACSSDDSGDDSADETELTTFTVSLSGEEENPPTSGSGSGTAELQLDTKSGEISGSLTVTDLTGDVTAAHIHEGEAGTNGAALIPLQKSSENTWVVPDDAILDSEQSASALSAGLYLNVHTEANPAGEIRGQIVPENYRVIRIRMAGENEVPPVVTDAIGTAYITLETDGDREIRGNITTVGLDTANAAHIHSAFAGENGAVVIGFEQDVGNTEFWQLPANSTVSEEQLETLMAGGTYINAHTQANPSGEIRGQVIPQGITLVRTTLIGDQEVPPVDTKAMGLAYITTHDDGAVTANIRTTDLSAPATGAHIHQAAPGNNGGVIIGLEQDANDSAFWRTPQSATLSSEQITAFRNGELYFNVHSDNHPAGEIRGQILPD